MTTLLELQARWEARRADAKRLRSMVDYDAVCGDVLADLRDLAESSDAATLSLTDAASAIGYHPGSLARMIKRGEAKNYGTAARPRVKLSELPRKGVSASSPPPSAPPKPSSRTRREPCSTIAGIELLANDPCAYCGAAVATTHDHIEPVSRGGAHAMDNLVRACWPCNREKRAQPLLLFLARRAIRRAA